MKHDDRKDLLRGAHSDLGKAGLEINKATRHDVASELCLEGVLAAHRMLIEALSKVEAVGLDLKAETGWDVPIVGNWETEAILDGLETRCVTTLRRAANIANGLSKVTDICPLELRMIAERGPIVQLKDFEKLSYPLLGKVRGAGFTTLVVLKEYFDSKNINLSE